MAELDSLEIKISADSDRAAQNITALADSLENLVEPATRAIEPLTKLSAALQAIKVPNTAKGLTAYAEAISTALNTLNGVSAKFDAKELSWQFETLNKVSDKLAQFKVDSSKADSAERLLEITRKLNRIETFGNVEKLARELHPIQQINDSLSMLKGGKGYETSAGNLASVVEKLNGISYNGNLGVFADNLKSSVEKIEEINVGKSLSVLEQLAPALERTTNALSNVVNSADNLQTVSEHLNSLASGIGQLSRIDISGSEQIVAFANNLGKIDISTTLAKNLADVGLAVKRISDAKMSTNAADNLRYFIDTVRIISEDDIRRLNAFSEAANATRNIKLKNLEIPEPKIDKTTAGSIQNTSSALHDLESVCRPVARVFGAVGDSVVKVSESFWKLETTLGRVSIGALSAALRALTSPLRAVGEGFSKAAKKATEMFNAIKRIAIYRAIRSAIKAITEGFREGRENLYQYSALVGTEFAPSMDKAATAALYLKNSIGAATAPLTNYLVPIIDKAVDSIVELINRFNELTATLTGAATWTKAIKFPTKWQEAADEATASARKLKSTMLGFDELNVIEPTAPASKKSAFDEDDYRKMFEEVQTNLQLNGKLQEIIMPLKLAWDAEGDRTLETIRNTFRSVIDMFGTIGESFKKVWENGTGQKTLETILRIAQRIFGTFGAIADNIKKAWERNDKGTRIIQATWDIVNNILTATEKIWGYTREFAERTSFNRILNSFQELLEYIERITNPDVGGFNTLRTMFHDVLLPIANWTIMDAAPRSIQLVTDALETLYDTFQYVMPNIDGVAESLRTGIISTFNYAYTILEQLIGSIRNGKDSIKDFVDAFTGMLSLQWDILEDALTVATNGTLETTFDTILSIVGNISGIFGELADGIREAWNENNNGVQIIQNVWDTVNNLLTVFDDLAASAREWFKNIDLVPITDAFRRLADEIKYLTDPSGTLAKILKSLFDNVLKPLGTWLVEQELPKQIDRLSVSLDVLNGMLEVIRPALDEVFKAFGKSKNLETVKQMLDPFRGVVDNIRQLGVEFKNFGEEWSIGADMIKQGFDGMLDGVAQKWDEFKNGLSESWQSFKDNSVILWQTVKELISQEFAETEANAVAAWTGIKTKFTDSVDETKKKFDNFKKDWNNGWQNIKQTANTSWDNITKTLSSGWSNFKQFFTDYKDNWHNGFEDIKKSVGNAWDSLTQKIGDSFEWSKLTQRVSDYTSAWQSGFKLIEKTVTSVFETIKNTVSGIVTSVIGFIGNIWNDGNGGGVYGTISKVLHGVADFIGKLFGSEYLGNIFEKFKPVLNNVIGVFENAINYIVKGLNFFVENFNKALDIHIEIPSFVPLIGGASFDGFSIPEIPEFNFYKFAKGGFPQQGSMFIANESGAEMVGKIGTQTAVVNNDQIVQAVSKGVYDAMLSALSQANRGDNNGKTELHVYLDRQELTAQVEQQQRDNGVSIFGGLVYN